MRMKYRLFSLLLALLMVLAPTAAFAAAPAAPSADTVQAATAELEAMRLALEQKYYIDIRYDVDSDRSPSIGTGSLHVLDTTLSLITPEVVSQVSYYFEQLFGKRMCFAFVYSPYQEMGGYNFDVLGSFEQSSGLIELYLPAYSRDVAMTGDSPLTIAHEFGHAFYRVFDDLHGRDYGVDAFENGWLSLNAGLSYNGNDDTKGYNPGVFMSAYGATTPAEDFAEVFSHSFVRHKAGMGIGNLLIRADGTFSPLGTKVNYIEKALPMYLQNTEQAIANMRRVYTATDEIVYEGVKLSGEYLQFSGCSYPRYILNSLLYVKKIQAETTEWIIDIGGWRVTGPQGTFFVFPGGNVRRVQPQPAA